VFSDRPSYMKWLGNNFVLSSTSLTNHLVVSIEFLVLLLAQVKQLRGNNHGY